MQESEEEGSERTNWWETRDIAGDNLTNVEEKFWFQTSGLIFSPLKIIWKRWNGWRWFFWRKTLIVQPGVV